MPSSALDHQGFQQYPFTTLDFIITHFTSLDHKEL